MAEPHPVPVTVIARSRYSAVAIVLHWTIALLIVGQLASGLWMVEALRQPATQLRAFEVYQLHKSVGLLVLVLSLLRLLWRLANAPPPLPAATPAPLRVAATATHLAFYALMIATPLVGWAMVSASPLGLPTIVFGLFDWPHLGWLAGPAGAGLEPALKAAHRWMGYAFMGLLALHVAAALKHHLIDRDDVLSRMLPLVRRRHRTEDA